MKVIISLGSNTNQVENIHRAEEELRRIVAGAAFTQPVWTDPVPEAGHKVGTAKYLNCLASGDVALSQDELRARLRQIEHLMDDSHESHAKGTVRIDLDLIQYGDCKLEDIVWLSGRSI